MPSHPAASASRGGSTRRRWRAWYAAATAFVFPSLAEGFGLPVLEALARGVPVACSNTSSLPEVAGDAVLYFDPMSPSAISRAIERLVTDDDLPGPASSGRPRAGRAVQLGQDSGRNDCELRARARGRRGNGTAIGRERRLGCSSPREELDSCAPALDEPACELAIVEQSSNRRGDRRLVLWLEEQCGIPGHLREGRPVRAGDGDVTCHRFEHR